MVAGEIYGKRILFGVLNWGLGHATRSSALIRQLLQQDNQVTLVSSGQALQYLRHRFEGLSCIEMPAQEIVYATHRYTWLSVLMQQKKIRKNIAIEKQELEKCLKEKNFDLVISDNCYGFYDERIYSILLTHQVNLQAPFFERTAQRKIHRLLQPFHEIWVPDVEEEYNLSGRLSHPGLQGKSCTYIGALSEMDQPVATAAPVVYAYCAVISGPEKHRTLFENQVIDFLLEKKAPAVLVRGTTRSLEKKLPDHILAKDFCTSSQVKTLMQQSQVVIGRTGYTTLMDLYALQKPCILVPTPGQTEQEYLFEKHFGKVPASLSSISPKKISPCKG